jgi:hypothetical protein
MVRRCRWLHWRATTKWCSIYWAASASGDDQIVQWLLDAGADANVPDQWNGTAPELASSGGHSQVVQRLIDAGADVNHIGITFGTALTAATSAGHDTVVRQLLEAGADVNARSLSGRTALYWAVEKSHHQVTRRLLDAGADLNVEAPPSRTDHEQMVHRLLRIEPIIQALGMADSDGDLAKSTLLAECRVKGVTGLPSFYYVLAYRCKGRRGNAPPDHVPSPLDGYKAPYPPLNLRLATSFLLLYPSTHKRPPSSPPCSLALVSGAPLASCGATSRPLQPPFCLRLTHHIPAASCPHSTTLQHVIALAACN